MAVVVGLVGVGIAGLLATPAAAQTRQQFAGSDSEAGEVWVTSQGTHRLFVVHGLRGQGGIETLNLPPGTGPHLTNFSPDGEYAYVSGMGNGDLVVVRADGREIVATLNFDAPAGTHQAMPSPDGETLLVAQIPSKKLIKVAANEATETWTPTGQELTLAKSPICTIFRDDGQRAYVSLLPSGIQLVDVATMTPVGDEIPTDGFVACGMVKEHDGGGIMLASSGGGGHVYRLDFATGTLESRGTLGASDWHSFRMSPNEKLGFGSVPTGDEVRLVDLASDPVTSVALPLDPTAGIGNDEPDNMAVRGNTLYATLRESGKLAIVQVKQGTVDYLQLSPANPSFNPANCAGCAVHGVAVRPVAVCKGRPATIVGSGRVVGTRRADVIVGSPGRDRIDGRGGDDLVCAGRGGDRVRGGRARDRLFGQQGRDRLFGGAGGDRLFGGPSADRLHGGSGRDRLSGGPGNDRIAAAGRERDLVSCGSGRDRVRADQSDRVRRCERVRRRR